MATRKLTRLYQGKARNIVDWVHAGYVKTYAMKKNSDEMVTELERYCGLLKRAMYKEEFL